MTVIVLLFIGGVVLIGSEVFLLGGIIGAIGGAMMVGGISISYTNYGALGAFISTVIAIALVVVALFFEFKVLPKTAIGKRLFMSASIQSATKYSNAEDDVIGKTCHTITALAPTGFVLLDGKKLEAASKSGFIEKNEEVRITAKDNFRIIVSKI